MTIKDEFLQLVQDKGVRQIRVTVLDDSSLFGMRDVQLFPDIGHGATDEVYDWACREMRGEIESVPLVEAYPNGL